MIDSLVIVSGGMDSVTLLHHLVKERNLKPAVITFLYGQKHRKEVEFAKFNTQLLGCTVHQVLDLSAMRMIFEASALVSDDRQIPTIQEVQGDSQPITYVPNRNMIFLALAVAWAETLGVTEVYYGAQAHDMYGYWDCTPDFLNQVNQVYQLNRKTPIQIIAPFVEYSKADILKLGTTLEVDYAKTWSCYEGKDKACGVCPTCAERLKAFEVCGLKDPIQYQ
jgi:7-cyano-7-deazaguanine synthase